MKTNDHTILLTLATALLISTSSGAVEIRQEPYLFQTTMTRNVTSDTFVISEQQKIHKLPIITMQIPLVYFELGSAVLAPASAATILSGLQRAGISRKTPLSVTGYTCVRGTTFRNNELSSERATTVAGFLRDHGFTVATAEGMGASRPITRKPEELYKNRRVEITTHP